MSSLISNTLLGLLVSVLSILLLLWVMWCPQLFRFFVTVTRRRVDEALTAGREAEEYPKSPGGKPVMWEVWVDKHWQRNVGAGRHGTPLPTQVSGNDSWDGGLSREGHWEKIMPVSAKILPPVSPSPVDPTRSPTPSSSSAVWYPALRRRLRLPVFAPPVPAKLEVSVLILMPDRNGGHARVTGSQGKNIEGDADGDGPDLLFGITEVGVRS